MLLDIVGHQFLKTVEDPQMSSSSYDIGKPLEMKQARHGRMRQRAYQLFSWLIKNNLEKNYQFENKIKSINKLINYLYISKQETELLIPAQTGYRTIKIYKSTERVLSVDHWPPERKDMQLIIDLIIVKLSSSRQLQLQLNWDSIIITC